ncbi:hypothetical protein [Azohydromonas lata]|uniref:hypothetical protein n=1 Tax=Azohydromonas lata TaxID=45677 RepID=UPI00082E015B|nr:hypothetical protein [Azohydromonas lata]
MNGIFALKAATGYSAVHEAHPAVHAATAAAADDPGTVYDIGKASKAAEILSRYDLHDISYHERQELGRQLQKAGILTDEQMLDFNSPSFMHFDGNMRPLPDEKQDFAGDVKSALAAARSRMDGQRSVPWLEKLDGLVESLTAVSGQG